MAESKKEAPENGESMTGESGKTARNYEQLIDRLKKERHELQQELNNNFREARRYVRSNPEEGVLIGFLGGIALGYLFGKLSK